MSRTVQFNIRTDPGVADAVRERARVRGCSLGTALAELVEAGRAWSGEGLVLRPDPALRRALDALAAAEGSSPGQILDGALRGEIRRQLLELAAALPEPPRRTVPPPPRDEAPAPQDDEPTDEVGLFTVFD